MELQMNKAIRCNRLLHGLIAGVLLFGIGACSNTKYLSAGESLYTGSKVKVIGSGLKKKQSKAITNELLALTRPKPNTSILGIRYKLFLYNIAGHPKKQHSPAAWLKRHGEPPVLLSSVNVDKNVKLLANNMENRGYFQVNAAGDTVVKSKRATAIYTVKSNDLYTISKVHFPEDSSAVSKAIAAIAGQSLLKPGKPYNLDIIKAEYGRIDANLKENGFYYFNPDYLITKADTNNGNHQVEYYISVKPKTPEESKKIFTINKVFIYSQYSLNAPGSDTSTRNAFFYKGYYVVDRTKQFKPSLFEQTMQFDPGDVYNRTDHNLSLNRLINLNLFRFVKNRFEVVRNDSSKLNTYYYLTPLPKQALRVELNGNSKSNNYNGSQVSVSWRNRNFFKGGELLTVNGTYGFEVQVNGYNSNIYRVGLEGTLTYPRFLVPFLDINPSSGFVPKTNITLAYEALDRVNAYTLNSLRGSFGYAWKQSPLKEHQFSPISINYVQPLNVSQQYLDSVRYNISLRRAIEKQFILGSTYNYNYNQLVTQPSTGIYFNGNVDLSGNIAGLITGANYKTGDSVKLFGLAFAQYVKLEGDFRYYKKMADNTVLANRIIVGLGVPYGNSIQLPYIKQFFAGGSNDIRAFRSRVLGPGSSLPPTLDANSKTTFVAEQSGDIKLELNTELRQKLFSVVQGALFADAGNIWLYNDDPTKPGAKFTGNFLKEMAVGAGAGLRFDFSILILRLDLAIPLRKPWLPDGERWVFNKIDFLNQRDPNWRKNNLIFNLAIGYPF